MKQRIIIGMLMCAGILTMSAMEDVKEQIKVLASPLVIGALVGVTEVVVDQPLIAAKNWLQLPRERRKNMRLDLKTAYRGLGANIACMGPAVSLQVAVNTVLGNLKDGETLDKQIMRASLAGIASSVAANPIELVVLHQQMKGAGVEPTIKALRESVGIKGILRRGIVLTALREGGFAPGYLVVYPYVENVIDDLVHNKGVAKIGSGMITGCLVAGITHPLDTIKTRMQADVTKEAIEGAVDAIVQIVDEIDEKTQKRVGIKGLYKGVSARATRAVIAFPVMRYAYETYTKIGDKHM